VFAYLTNIDDMPEWATEFARELRFVDGRYKVVNGLGEFFFEIRADAESGVIDMLARPREDALQLFPTRVVPVVMPKMRPSLVRVSSYVKPAFGPPQ
jgi:hypothetical protein